MSLFGKSNKIQNPFEQDLFKDPWAWPGPGQVPPPGTIVPIFQTNGVGDVQTLEYKPNIDSIKVVKPDQESEYRIIPGETVPEIKFEYDLFTSSYKLKGAFAGNVRIKIYSKYDIQAHTPSHVAEMISDDTNKMLRDLFIDFLKKQ